jgi:hypothetical protein
MKAVTLKNCPFCGAQAELLFRRYEGTGASGMETPEPYVRCTTAWCVVMAAVPCDDWPYGQARGALTQAQAIEVAAERWNSRILTGI